MKKYFCLIIIITLKFLSIPVVNADYGACSYHNGVNCNIRDWDGSVICNDGWRASTVLYSNAEECKISKNSCDYLSPYYYGLTYGLTYCTEDQYQRILDDKSEALSGVNGLNAARGLTGSPEAERSVNEVEEKYHKQLQQCADSIESKKKIEESYNQCLKEESDRLQKSFDYQQQLNAWKTQQEKENETFQHFILFTQYCKSSVGDNGFYNSTTDKCECLANHLIHNGQCKSRVEVYKETQKANKESASDLEPKPVENYEAPKKTDLQPKKQKPLIQKLKQLTLNNATETLTVIIEPVKAENKPEVQNTEVKQQIGFFSKLGGFFKGLPNKIGRWFK